MVGPTLDIFQFLTYRAKARKVIVPARPLNVGGVQMCVAMPSEKNREATMRRIRGCSHFQKPLTSVYWLTSSFQKVLSEAPMQARGWGGGGGQGQLR